MYRKEIFTYCLSIVFVLMAALLHILEYFHLLNFSVNVPVFALYTYVILFWKRNMENRILRTSSITRIRSISFLLIGYLATRTLKYEILINNPAAMDHVRNFYYFFSLNIVHLVFFTCLLIAKSEREPINKWWNLLWIPTETFILLILTNDFHNLAFTSTQNGISQYGPLFYIILIYISILGVGSVILTFRPALSTTSLKSILIPNLILIIWAIYTFLYITDWKYFYFIKISFKSAEFNILIVILFIESLVFTRLLPSNRGYDRFLKLSSLNIGIMNLDEKIVFSPKEGPKVSPSLIKKALGNPSLINKDTLLESATINGGIAFWFINLKELNSLKRKLFALNENLMNENDLLIADNKLKENMAKLEEQNEIRSYIDKKLNPQFNHLKKIIEHLPENEFEFEKALKNASIFNVYIKRYSNLFLLSKNKKNLPLSEVRLAFWESLDYLKLKGVEVFFDWQVEDSLDAQICLYIYEIFQNILELHLNFLYSISLLFEKNETDLELIIRINSPKLFSIEKLIKKIESESKISVFENLEKENPYWIIKIKGVIE